MSDTYKVTAIDTKTGDIKVIFSIDNKEQTLGGMPINDADALKEALSIYADAYRSGLQVEVVEVDKGVHDLIGKTQEVVIPEIVNPDPIEAPTVVSDTPLEVVK